MSTLTTIPCSGDTVYIACSAASTLIAGVALLSFSFTGYLDRGGLFAQPQPPTLVLYPPPPGPPRVPAYPDVPSGSWDRVAFGTCSVDLAGVYVSLVNNNKCEDGGELSVNELCPWGTDYPDCPARWAEVASGS